MHRPILAVITLVHILAAVPKASANFDLWPHVSDFTPTYNLLSRGQTRRVGDLPFLSNHHLPSEGPILLSADNDGVLKPVNDATREDRARAVQLVETLGQSSRVVTLVNSARSLPALDSYRGIGVNLVAEHGTVVLPADQSWQKDFDVEGTDNIRYRIKQIADRHPGARIEFKDPKNSIAFKHADADENEEMRRAFREMEGVLQNTRFTLKKVGTGFSEIRHVDVNKGNFVAKLLQSGEFRGGIALGDTEADEGMFKAMNQMGNRRFISVIVSNNLQQPTNAQYRLSSVGDVHEKLYHLVG
ncbi:hypothetical protein PCANC_05672 [Puccinia coronata f. sp. avenae]|uniref:Trehalose 6-phosphate phosphatase n=1 Tax=Puccinia coronata f. sp. avenae TaxID=200324 RepID=A0A2N5VXU0_9BASI|nr:hypothetical protein PCANC_05672 [Puccinia coronata f. sp. avenae]